MPDKSGKVQWKFTTCCCTSCSWADHHQSWLSVRLQRQRQHQHRRCHRNRSIFNYNYNYHYPHSKRHEKWMATCQCHCTDAPMHPTPPQLTDCSRPGSTCLRLPVSCTIQLQFPSPNRWKRGSYNGAQGYSGYMSQTEFIYAADPVYQGLTTRRNSMHSPNFYFYSIEFTRCNLMLPCHVLLNCCLLLSYWKFAALLNLNSSRRETCTKTH